MKHELSYEYYRLASFKCICKAHIKSVSIRPPKYNSWSNINVQYDLVHKSILIKATGISQCDMQPWKGWVKQDNNEKEKRKWKGCQFYILSNKKNMLSMSFNRRSSIFIIDNVISWLADLFKGVHPTSSLNSCSRPVEQVI